MSPHGLGGGGYRPHIHVQVYCGRVPTAATRCPTILQFWPRVIGACDIHDSRSRFFPLGASQSICDASPSRSLRARMADLRHTTKAQGRRW